MKAAADFAGLCAALPPEEAAPARRVEVRLFGSLSATAEGHGTPAAIMAGLTGYDPAACPPGLLQRLQAVPEREYALRCAEHAVPVSISSVIHDAVRHDFPYSNTLCMSLLDENGASLVHREYYSVGGGFVQWKGWSAPERGKPAHPYGSMRVLREWLRKSGLTLHELILENESAITGRSRPAIFAGLDEILEAMSDSVQRGLDADGTLPGGLNVARKAKTLLTNAAGAPHAADRFLGKVNAYAFAAAEENAGGGVVVTAPTCGSAGVVPALLRAMLKDLNIGARAAREGLLASAAVAFLAKHNAGIAGAEMGCQGEVGVASAMAAAMLAHARGNAVEIVENAAEIALEHHLGLTCDPVGGYVQIPCIERNAVGAIKAYNACLLATCEDVTKHRVTLDAAIRAMADTGREMSIKLKETSQAGLAVSMTEC
jgi:L-serine dehydratase